MKKNIILFTVMLALASCANEPNEQSAQNSSGKSDIKFYCDPVTNVEYILYSGEAITPRLNPDGTLFIRKEEE